MRPAQRIRAAGTGHLMMTCIFHQDLTPSLRIWRSGRYLCYGCGAKGDVKDHPELAQVHYRVRMEALEAAGQLRLPGF